MSDKLHKVLASLGALAVVIIPTIEASAYATNPKVLLGLNIVTAVLGFFGLTVIKPLNTPSAGSGDSK
jgi:hypothetical protein